MTTLLIVRHGNTFGAGDVVTRVGGRTDLPLVESGLRQGTLLGEYLLKQNLIPDVIFTSTLRRTIETAQMIRDVLGGKIPQHVLSDFNEIDYGPDENRPETEVVARLGQEALSAWDESGVVPNGWLVDPEKLINDWIAFGRYIAEEFTNQRVLVVSSNGIIRFAPYLTGDFAAFREQHKIKVSTGALCWFEFAGGKWVCKDWNVRPDKAD